MRVVSLNQLIERLAAVAGDDDPFVLSLKEAADLHQAGDDDAGAEQAQAAMNLLDTYSEAARQEILDEMSAWLFGGDGSNDADGLIDLPTQGNA